MKKDDMLEITIEDISSDGSGVGKADGFALFVKDTIPGDQVKVKIMKMKKRYGYARLMEILVPSPDRIHSTVHPGCPALAGVAKGRSAVQKIQLDKVEAPVVQHPVEHPAQIVQHGWVVDIQRIETAPVTAAAPRFAVHFQQPVRVLPEKGRVLFAHKGRKP